MSTKLFEQAAAAIELATKGQAAADTVAMNVGDLCVILGLLRSLSSQSLSLSEARAENDRKDVEIERLKGLVAGIRECPQEPVNVAAWRKAMEGVTPGPWNPSRFGMQVLTGDSWSTICTFHDSGRPDGKWNDYRLAAWEDGRGAALETSNADWVARCSPAGVSGLLNALESALWRLEKVRTSRFRWVRRFFEAKDRATAAEREIAQIVVAWMAVCEDLGIETCARATKRRKLGTASASFLIRALVLSQRARLWRAALPVSRMPQMILPTPTSPHCGKGRRSSAGCSFTRTARAPSYPTPIPSASGKRQ